MSNSTSSAVQQFEHDGFNSPNEVEVAQRKAAQQTPGPWFVEPCTEGRDCRRWSVARWNPAADPGYDYESMEDGCGNEAIFNSPDAARAAIAKAQGASA